MNDTDQFVRPEYVNTVGGWASDLVALLWGKCRTDHAYFARLDRRVLSEVQFPCVILAKFSFGTVAIDCNDSEAYQLDDPGIVLYLKLQFRPGHPYAVRRTYPFTYPPQQPLAFLARLQEYRKNYAEGAKASAAWGRFIAVSIDRFRIAHEMRRLGLPGGCYALCDDGYQDHALDPVMPRRRMPFDEYLASMNRASSIVDAKGFGDLTHRTVESLAIGVPLIRPRLDNQLCDPLIAGVHYLDCGHGGEHLAECVAAMDYLATRQALIQNGIAWFERNATPTGLRRVFARILRETGFLDTEES